LDRQLGIRWLWPGKTGEVIPRHDQIRIPVINKTYQPSLAWAEWRNHIIKVNYWQDPQAAADFHKAQKKWLKTKRFLATENIRPSPQFQHYWKKYSKTHPEYFSKLPDGTRRPLTPKGRQITLCVSQPTLWKQIIDDWIARGKPDILKVGENDSPAMCTCQQCRAWDAPDWRFYNSPYWAEGKIPSKRDLFTGTNIGLAGDGSPWGGWFIPTSSAPSLSDRHARFYKTIYAMASELNPDVTVGGFAYTNYWHAPTHARLNEHILINFVPPLWFPYTEQMSRTMRINWEGWKATEATLMYRPNLTWAGHNFPIYYADRLIEDLLFVLHDGTIAVDFDSLIGSWGVQGPAMYGLGRAVNRPDLTKKEILDEFYSAFGPTEKAVRAYFNHWKKVSENISEDDINLYYFEEGGGGVGDWYLLADRIFTPSMMTQGHYLLDKAFALAEQANAPAAKERVVFLQKGLTHAQLTLIALIAHDTYQANPTDPHLQVLQKAVQELYRFRASTEKDFIGNMGYLSSVEPKIWQTYKK
jgi:hypothetical protein